MVTLPDDIKEMQALPLATLTAKALAAKLRHRKTDFSLCSIINAKSGKCSEDCRFCAQSAHYRTDAPVYPLKDIPEIVAAAGEAKKNGASHFSMVTSGRNLSSREIPLVAAAIAAIRDQVEIKVCASFGILGPEDFARLKAAGLSRYHHNLESSREFFPRICTTHSFNDRLATIRAAQECGLEICSGGIFGLGETEEDRLSMAITLRECGVDSVPINILMPLAGTPLAGQEPLPALSILRAVALYRLILPEVPIRLAGGRETALGDFLSAVFMAGADGMMIGGYLTQRGRPPEKDNLFVAEMKAIWSA